MKKQNKSAPPEPVVYCGPSIRGVAKQYTVYLDGIPAGLQALKDKIPVTAELIVPIEQMAQTRALLTDANSTMSLFYDAVINSLTTLTRR